MNTAIKCGIDDEVVATTTKGASNMATQTTGGAQATSKPSIGSPAHDLTLTNTAGESVKLSDLWREKPLVIVFLRHYGCTFCREQVMLIKRDYGKIVESGATVVCVAMGPYKAAKAFQIVMELPFEILSTGDDLTPFRLYGLDRVNLRDALNPLVWWRVLVNTARGIINNPFAAQGDPAQMHGSFVIGIDGLFDFVEPAKRVDQVVDPSLLIAAVEKR